ncbi:MAG: preprotein translocase subunit YajC [Candidatus Latescibacteria bacterium]|nr:preprotein translocase subunit YajC [Candidatus Latescibacterota bacterium]
MQHPEEAELTQRRCDLITEVYAMATQGGTTGGGGGFAFLIPFILIFLVFYLLLILPQQKKQKAHQAMLNSLSKGDRVVTVGGLYGTIVGMKDGNSIVVLKIADNIKVEVSKSSIAGLVKTKERR